MMRMDAATYALSVISTPTFGLSAASGPMQNGITCMVLPRIDLLYRSARVRFISAGDIQLSVGRASAESTEAGAVPEGRLSTFDSWKMRRLWWWRAAQLGTRA